MRSGPLSWLPPAALLAATWFAAGVFADVDPIVIKGSKFFYKTNGTQFYIKGVAYQQNAVQSGGNTTSFSDPLADAAGCARDIPYLTALSTNTIRVYAVDPTADHSQCMSMLANAGIYTLIDLGSPNSSITSDSPSWTTDLFSRYKSVVDAFAQYNNVLGFFSANEVVFSSEFAAAAPFVKAATRDTKAYIKSKGYRSIGVGYATDDDPSIVGPVADFLNCGDQSSAIDFFGFNVYSWCGQSTFAQSGYQADTAQFQDYSIPAFLSEYGCNKTQPRIFQDTPVIYSSLMDGVWSGGIVYLYFNDQNNYGLVSVSSGSSSVSTLPDYENLSSQIATVSPTIVTASNYSPSNSPQACPTSNSNFAAVASPLPPTPDTSFCTCMYSQLACVPAGSVSQSNYGSLFNYVCSQPGNLCDGINANGTTGTYGAFSFCNNVVKLGYVLNQYYMHNGGGSANCQFSGSAVLRATSAPSGSCASVLSSASSSSAAASTSATGTSKAAGHMNTVVGAREGGLASIMILVPVAIISGVGMILL